MKMPLRNWILIGLVIYGMIVLLEALIAQLTPSPEETLAKKMGVRLSDYPPIEAFPYNYFYHVLKPGMTIDEVHRFVVGYSKVLRCGENDHYFSEIYFYYSKDGTRYEIFYDDAHHYKEIRGEDINSPTIMTDGCVEGLIKTAINLGHFC